MNRILSFTGASGSGKTTIVRELIRYSSKVTIVPTNTTRRPRLSDLRRECLYLSRKQFEDMKSSGQFLWTIEHGGNSYGTRRASILEVFKKEDRVGAMILAHPGPSLLIEFLTTIGKQESYSPFYIIPPPREVLEERMRGRGDKEDDIKRRLDQSSHWYKESRSSNVKYTYIPNNGTIEEAVQEVLQKL